MGHESDEDLAPTMTAGYKPPAVKTVDELKELDSNDESLKKWKESLLKGAASGAKQGNDKKVQVTQLAMEINGRPDVVLDLSSGDVKSTNIVIKEGIEYRMKVKFRVNFDVVAGLKYLQVVKRKGIRVDKTEEMIGSYGPAETEYEKRFAPEQAPAGMLARGHYSVRSKFVDDDGVCHLDVAWTFDIKKDWSGDE